MPVASPNFPSTRPAPLLPLPRRTIGDDVLDTLRKSIIAGAFAPGDHIAEGSLGQQLGVSRAPVREAMMQLEREGLLVFDKRGAALVKTFTEDDFEEIFSLRLELETMAARLACRNFSATDAERMADNIERTRTASRLLELTLLDVEFHDLMVQAARHSRLAMCWATLRHQLEFWLARMQSRLAAPVPKTREATVRNHQGLLTALRSGNERRAVKAIREHIEGWRRQQANGATGRSATP
jgi:DNA-binding GntR family transcriptional regulator